MLLESEAVFYEALRAHEAHRTELSRRALEAARVQLEAAAAQAEALSVGSSALHCRRCGGPSRAERWKARAAVREERQPEEVTFRRVEGVPEWAAEYALQGCDVVTRYTCVACGEVVAILARDE